MEWNGIQEHERQLKYAKWRTYQSSHLLENIKHEFLDSEGQVDDHYLVEKARKMEKKLLFVLYGTNEKGWPHFSRLLTTLSPFLSCVCVCVCCILVTLSHLGYTR